MTASYEILRALSLMAFLFYGSACVFAGSMEADFERFGLSHMRVLVGSLELLGALGLLAGYFHAPLVAVASGGLSLLMLFGVATRIRVGDPFVASLPALTRVVFEDMDVSKAVIAPLKACKPLQEVAFDNCFFSLSETFDHGLPARVRVRSFTRRFQ